MRGGAPAAHESLLANPLAREIKSNKVCYNSKNVREARCSSCSSRREPMSLKPQAIGPIPEETALVAHAVYPKGNVFMRMRDELGTIYQDEAFAHLFSHCPNSARGWWLETANRCYWTRCSHSLWSADCSKRTASNARIRRMCWPRSARSIERSV